MTCCHTSEECLKTAAFLTAEYGVHHYPVSVTDEDVCFIAGTLPELEGHAGRLIVDLRPFELLIRLKRRKPGNEGKRTHASQFYFLEAGATVYLHAEDGEGPNEFVTLSTNPDPTSRTEADLFRVHRCCTRPIRPILEAV